MVSGGEHEERAPEWCGRKRVHGEGDGLVGCEHLAFHFIHDFAEGLAVRLSRVHAEVNDSKILNTYIRSYKGC